MIRVGLVGFGIAGKAFHAPIISAVEGLELAAIVERTPRNAAAAYPEATIYPSLTAMLADETLELIVVATPTQYHLELGLEALRAGRHLVMDKPTAVNPAEIAQLIACAKAEEKLLIPFHNRRWDSDFRTLRNLLHEEKLGRVVSFDSTFDRWRPVAHPDSLWREGGAPGSGILLDLGTHQVDQAVQLFGLPLGVSADVARERDGAVSDDYYNVRLRYAGLIATISGNNLTAIPKPHFAVRGTHGGYIKWGLDPQEDLLRKHGRVIEPGWGTEPASSWGTLAVDVNGNMVTQPVEPIPGDYRLFYDGVRDALQSKSAPPVDPVDAWRVASILQWALESSIHHQEILCDWNV